MIVVLTSVPIDPDRRAAADEHAERLVEQSATEDGTVRYRAMADCTDPNLLHFFEQYEDAAAAEAHTESETYRRFVEALPEIADGRIETIQIDADGVQEVSFTAEEAVAALD